MISIENTILSTGHQNNIYNGRGVNMVFSQEPEKSEQKRIGWDGPYIEGVDVQIEALLGAIGLEQECGERGRNGRTRARKTPVITGEKSGKRMRFNKDEVRNGLGLGVKFIQD